MKYLVEYQKYPQFTNKFFDQLVHLHNMREKILKYPLIVTVALQVQKQQVYKHFNI